MGGRESHFIICTQERTIQHQGFDSTTTQAAERGCNSLRDMRVKGQQMVGKKQAPTSLSRNHPDGPSKDS